MLTKPQPYEGCRGSRGRCQGQDPRGRGRGRGQDPRGRGLDFWPQGRIRGQVFDAAEVWNTELRLMASWHREALRLEAVLHEAEAKTHEAEAEARFFGLEDEARPRGLTSLVE